MVSLPLNEFGVTIETSSIAAGRKIMTKALYVKLYLVSEGFSKQGFTSLRQHDHICALNSAHT